jgi:endo-1,4-beta-xylanase
MLVSRLRATAGRLRLVPGATLAAAWLASVLIAACGQDPGDADPDLVGGLDAAITPAQPGDAAQGVVRDGAAWPALDAAIGPGRSDAGAAAEAAVVDARVQEPTPLDASARADAGAREDAGLDAASGLPDAAAADAGRDASSAGGDAGSSKPKAKFVGNITTRGQVRSDFASMWNQITPENEGKWGSVEPTRDQMNWAGLDRVYAYAREHGLLFKQHTMVWGSQQPSWLAGLPASEQAAEVEEWIRLFCQRYPDTEMIDVVNEPPPHTTPVYMNALGGAGASGYDWIVRSFKLTRQYCPKAILILNDYNTIEYGNDNTRIINIANAVKRAGAPIDAIGAQAHDAFKLPTATVQQLLDKLAKDTGLPVYITEYDIDLANDAQQRQVMESQFGMFWRNSSVKGITIWGYVSGATWRPNTGLMSEAGTPRPALTWLRDFLGTQANISP